MNVGLTVDEFVKDAELVAGLEVIVQAYDRESLFASLLRAPVNATVELVVTFWFVPAFATGATFALADVIDLQSENGLDELEDALQAVSVTELVATLLLPSVMVMVAT